MVSIKFRHRKMNLVNGVTEPNEWNRIEFRSAVGKENVGVPQKKSHITRLRLSRISQKDGDALMTAFSDLILTEFVGISKIVT
jgi:hypothetical protein